MKPGYFNALGDLLGGLLLRFHLVRGDPAGAPVVIAVAVGFVALTLGLILASRIFAPSSAGAVAGIALGACAIVLALDAVRFQLEPVALVLRGIFAVLALTLIVALTRRALDATAAAAVGTLVVGSLFAALISTLIGLAMQLSNAM